MRGKDAWRVQEFPYFDLHVEQTSNTEPDVRYISSAGSYSTLEEAQIGTIRYIKTSLLKGEFKLIVHRSMRNGWKIKGYCKPPVWISSVTNSGIIDLGFVSDEYAKKFAEKIYQLHKARFFKVCEKLGI